MQIFFILAVTGLVLSALAHLLTFCGVNPEQAFPWIWMLHIGIFVVWIPTVLVGNGVRTRSKKKDLWNAAAGYSPRWLNRLCGCLFIYAFFNFFFTIFALNKGGVPGVINGEKVLHSHGTVIRKLSDEEYELHRAYTVRTFSGHWMVFYGIATTVLLSEIRRRSAERQRKLE